MAENTVPTSSRTEADAIIEAARTSADPAILQPLSTYAVATPNGVQVIDLDTDEHRRRRKDNPRRKTGTRKFTEHPSFVLYVTQHTVDNVSTIWADRDAGQMVAVLNDHANISSGYDDDFSAGWGDHRAVLTLRQTPAWKAWTKASGDLVSQTTFAEFLEDRAADVVDPDAARLLEVATSIEATKSAAMKSATRLDNGEVKVRYEETIEARAGQAGDLTIPTRIELALSPYEGMDPYKVTARLRYRIGNGELKIGVVLDRPEDIIRAAFGDVVDRVADGTGLAVFHGQP